MILRRDETIKKIRVWNAKASERKLRLDQRFDASDLAHAILGDVTLRLANATTNAIQEFFSDAEPLKIDLGNIDDAESLFNCLVENVPGLSSAATVTDLAAIPIGRPDAVMKEARL